ncbi:MAG: type II toxin-antitoxin system HicB family antitoxin [Lachnospiraceae bacterium]|nr:type II toxin-antitoxin system HicB family antitoxin [Lachnospiraceae bacterium]
MLSSFPACFFKEDNGYSVIFPDLNYLATCGSDLDDALYMAVDCLAGYILWLWEDEEEVPAASAIEDIDPLKICEELDFTYTECFVKMISVDVMEYAKEHF